MCCDSPDPPDPYQTADAQLDTNIKTADYTTALGRPTINTPWGSLDWAKGEDGKWTGNFTTTDLFDKYAKNFSQGSSEQYSSGGSSSFNNSTSKTSPTPIDNLMYGSYEALLPEIAAQVYRGVKTYDPTMDYRTAYNAADQQLVDTTPYVEKAGGVSGNANDVLSRKMSAFDDLTSQPLSYAGLGDMPDASDNTRKTVADALYSRAKSRLDPIFSQRDSDLNAKLAAQGITQGSEAYDREYGNLGRDRNDAYQGAMYQANSDAVDQMAKQFGMQMAARQQGVTETNTIRDQPLKEALGSGQLAGTTAGNFKGLLDSQTGQFGAMTDSASKAVQSDLATQNAKTTNANAQTALLVDLLKTLRSGGQASLAESTSTGGASSSQNSYGSSNSESTSWNLPNIMGQGGGASVGNVPLSQMIANNYSTEVGADNASTMAGVSLAGAGLNAAATAGLLSSC